MEGGIRESGGVGVGGEGTKGRSSLPTPPSGIEHIPKRAVKGACASAAVGYGPA